MPLGGVFANTSECQMESRLDLQLLRSQEQPVVFGFAGSFQKIGLQSPRLAALVSSLSNWNSETPEKSVSIFQSLDGFREASQIALWLWCIRWQPWQILAIMSSVSAAGR